MRFMHFRVPLVILAIQTAPYTIEPDPEGRLRVTLGYGTAQYENQSFSCDGELISVDPVTLQSGGVQIDVWPVDRFRASLFGGGLSSTESDGGPLFGGLVLAYEGRSFGIGAGAAYEPEEAGKVPSFYARFGTLDSHLRLEVFPPTPVIGSTGWLRAGIGINQSRWDEVRGVVGIAMGPYSYADNPQPRVFADLDIPVHPRWDLGFRGQGGLGELGLQWSAAFLASYETRF